MEGRGRKASALHLSETAGAWFSFSKEGGSQPKGETRQRRRGQGSRGGHDRARTDARTSGAGEQGHGGLRSREPL